MRQLKITEKDRDVILKKIERLVELFQKGEIPKLEKHEVHPAVDKSSKLNYLYFTLPVALNFQRSSPALWQSALDTFEDPKTRYVFRPELVAKTAFAKLKTDLFKHRLALQRNKHPKIWHTISKTLYDNYNSDPRNIFAQMHSDVDRVKELLTSSKKDFPYLGGPKLSDYWLFILDSFTDIQLKNKQNISIIPDTHIKRASIKLGVTNSMKPEIIAETWSEILKDNDHVPIDLHPVLWHWGRNGFRPEV